MEKRVIKKTITIEIIESSDPSVQCIAALRSVMEHFTTKQGREGLSAMGNDRQAVVAWFTTRYPISMPNFKIETKL